jgi:outer membrane protein OmpA-like peptidoglycan-associated protein
MQCGSGWFVWLSNFSIGGVVRGRPPASVMCAILLAVGCLCTHSGNAAPAAGGGSEAPYGAPNPDSFPSPANIFEPPSVLSQYDVGATHRLRLEVGDRVFFAPGSASLGRIARIQLARQALWLKTRRARSVVVGHADDGGSMENDDRVASLRAQVVRSGLIAEGVPADWLKIVVMGRRESIALCGGPDCAAQNRRVVIVVMSTDNTKGF